MLINSDLLVTLHYSITGDKMQLEIVATISTMRLARRDKRPYRLDKE